MKLWFEVDIRTVLYSRQPVTMLFIRQEQIRSRNRVIYDTARKSNHGFLTPTVVRGRRTPWPSVWNLRSKTNWPTRFEKRRLRQISAYRPNVSIARDSEKSSIMTLWRIGSRPRAFQRAIDGVRTLPLRPPPPAKEWLKKRFFVWDRATAVCCAHVRKVHCAVVCTLSIFRHDVIGQRWQRAPC